MGIAKFQLLHISDLHVKSGQEFDRSVVLDPLIDRVEQDIADGIQPEIVVVTGDVGFSGKEAEYQKAKAFFDELLARMKLSQDRLFIVPGNHDVDRSKYRPKDIPAYESMKELNVELENEEYRADLLKGMNDYFTFMETSYPHLKSHDNRLIPFVHAFDAQCSKRIGLVGLNSAWMCRKSPDEREIAIGEYQINKAMEELKGKGKMDVVVTLFHHPLSWLWPPDRMICRKHLNNSVILCGHLHDAEGGYIHDYDGQLYQFQAGAGYESSEYPNRFQYVTFDWLENKVSLEFRKFVKESRKWVLDADKGTDGKKSFELLDTKDKTKLKPTVDFTPYLAYLRQETTPDARIFL
jgi:predicted MPP superfamily phosphohydrolase